MGEDLRVTELRRRRQKLAEELRRSGEQALLFTREGNVVYLCGYSTSTWSNFSRPIFGLLRSDESLVFVVAETEADAARERIPDVEIRSYVELRRVEPGEGLPDGRVQFGPQVVEVLDELLHDPPVERLLVDGLDAAFPPVAQLTRSLDSPPVLADASSLLWRQRLLKSDWEVDRLAESCSVLAGAFGELETRLSAGMSEREIHRQLAAAIFRAGADTLGYTNVFAGVERGLFGAPTDRRWEAGEVLYVDGGAVVDGYWADFCRMYVAGSAPTDAQVGYGRVVTGLEVAKAEFRDGMTAGELAAVIAGAVDLAPSAVGFGRFGHGIGLYMPEPPSLHPLDDTVLEDGMVICVEPAVEHDGANYVVEEQCVVREGRLVPISPPAPRSLIEID